MTPFEMGSEFFFCVVHSVAAASAAALGDGSIRYFSDVDFDDAVGAFTTLHGGRAVRLRSPLRQPMDRCQPTSEVLRSSFEIHF